MGKGLIGDKMEETVKKYCSICGKEIGPNNTYRFKDGTQDQCCKDCRLIGCSDSKPWTYFSIMQLFDIPYIEYIWFDNMMRGMKIATNTHVYNNVFGRYYSIMRLRHWRHFNFQDSQYINKSERQLPFSYRSKLSDMRHYFLDRDIPQEYYNIIGFE